MVRRRSTQVAGPTELAVGEGVVITRIQPTPKSFRVDTGDVVSLQGRSNAWRTAELKITVIVQQQHVRRRDVHACKVVAYDEKCGARLLSRTERSLQVLWAVVAGPEMRLRGGPGKARCRSRRSGRSGNRRIMTSNYEL